MPKLRHLGIGYYGADRVDPTQVVRASNLDVIEVPQETADYLREFWPTEWEVVEDEPVAEDVDIVEDKPKGKVKAAK